MIRRTFLGYMAMGAALVALPFQMACSVWTDIKNWTPVAIQAFNAIISLLEGAGVISITSGGPISTITGDISGGFAVLSPAIDTYLSATPPPTGALQKIEDILTAIVSNFQNFLAAINVPDAKLAALVTGLADVILSTIAGFQAQLPATAATAMRGFKLGNFPHQAITPVHRTRRAFIHQWNTLATNGGHKEIRLPESLIQHL